MINLHSSRQSCFSESFFDISQSLRLRGEILHGRVEMIACRRRLPAEKIGPAIITGIRIFLHPKLLISQLFPPFYFFSGRNIPVAGFLI